MVDAVGGPVTGTSANPSGGRGCIHPGQLDPSIAAQVDCILDAGPLTGGAGSTVVDITGGVPEILRPGSVSAAEVAAAFERYRRRHIDNSG
jgi:L-threonylcarbamoyladenylate synthase